MCVCLCAHAHQQAPRLADTQQPRLLGWDSATGPAGGSTCFTYSLPAHTQVCPSSAWLFSGWQSQWPLCFAGGHYPFPMWATGACLPVTAIANPGGCGWHRSLDASCQMLIKILPFVLLCPYNSLVLTQTLLSEWGSSLGSSSYTNLRKFSLAYTLGPGLHLPADLGDSLYMCHECCCLSPTWWSVWIS